MREVAAQFGGNFPTAEGRLAFEESGYLVEGCFQTVRAAYLENGFFREQIAYR